MIKKSKIFLPIIVLFFLVFLSQKRTDGFRIDRIRSHEKHNLYLNVKNQISFDKLDDILSQKFSYLGRGRQCFVFESEDKNFVIKFFDHYRFHRPYYFPQIHITKAIDFYREKRINRRKRRLHLFLNSYKMAYEELQDETGLLYVHLDRSNNLKREMHLTNKCHQLFKLDLDSYQFIVQKKAKPIFDAITEFKDPQEHYLVIDSFLKIIEKRCQKHIVDDDIDVGINFGVIGQKTINFDSGRLFYDDKLQEFSQFKKEMLKSTKYFRKWLVQNSEEDLFYFDKKFSNILESNR